ncbi:MAG: hypothetical protein DYG93_07290 [Leptolyngbya sp. PLA2]|nr:hypothetical protein [Leptolyngbya sp.]MCE7971451.1 hypothetical protein [Leptolyngbya sp. PL-A2]MCQ3940666.1 hypothetical protein [cyanobacterium CYA1]MCZ7632339.1 hypothetical protein [Phycisphaerales bacterium]MDL1903636.1 hypothetical protein [Synechococcales cyanobacterium CNB]GIK18387.1 MAG: hypothetical protein BroJett004_05510 [Planctomycetota bacterium]
MRGNASTTGQPQGGFARAFLPGLVLGLIIGAFAGAVIPPMLSGPPAPAPGPAGPVMQPRDRVEQPATDEVIEQGDRPSEEEPPEGEGGGG